MIAERVLYPVSFIKGIMPNRRITMADVKTTKATEVVKEAAAPAAEADKAKKPATKRATAAKKNVDTAAKKAKTVADKAKKAVKKDVEQTKADVEKVKKAAEKAAAAKDTVKFEYAGNQIDADEIAAKCRAAFKAANPRKAIKNFAVYVNADENKAYYTVDGKGEDGWFIEL
jgi:hypothetical protein